MALSLDGFVARENDDIAWLMKQNTEGEEHGFTEFEASVDGIIMGSGSFRNVLTLGPWHYKKPVVVMSQSMTEADVPSELQDKVRISALSPGELMQELDGQGWKRAYVDGGKVVQAFIRAGLVADLNLTHIPILLGEGKRLFGTINSDIDLELLDSTKFPSGLVQSHYKLVLADRNV